MSSRIAAEISGAPDESSFLARLESLKAESSPVTHRHEGNVARSVQTLALRLGARPVAASALARAAEYHDVGKMLVPKEVLDKPGRLDEREMELMRGHTTSGVLILAGCPSPLARMASAMALYHHERWDGAGYHGLSGRSIPLPARLLAVCDVWDALTSPDRPYKGPIPPGTALRMMVEDDSTGRLGPGAFDPRILRSFALDRLDRHAGEIAPGEAGAIRDALAADRRDQGQPLPCPGSYALELARDPLDAASARHLVALALGDRCKFEHLAGHPRLDGILAAIGGHGPEAAVVDRLVQGERAAKRLAGRERAA